MPDQTAATDNLSGILAAGAVRLRANDALRAGCFAALGALAAMVLLVLLQRLFFFSAPIGAGKLAFLRMPAWGLWALLVLALAPFAAAAAAYARSRQGVLSAALAADERLDLRARLSSAVALGASGGTSPMSPALLADARRHAAALVVGREFPLRAPRAAIYLPPGLLALALALAIMPNVDLLGRKGGIEEQAAKKEEIRQVAQLMEKRIEALSRKPEEPPRSERLPSEKLKDDMSKLVNELKEAADREQAATKLNKLLDEAKMAEERVAGMEKLARQMEQLEKLGDKADLPKGAVQEAAAAMARGDFQKAAEELKKLAEDLKGGKLPEGKLAELKRDLERLAKMSDDWKELAKELGKAASELGEGDQQQALEELAAAMEDLKELAELLKELGAEGGDGDKALQQEGQRLQLTEEMIKQLKDMLKNAQRCAFCKKMYCINCGQPRCGCEGLPQCQCQGGDGCQGVVGVPGMGLQGGGAGGGGKGAGSGGPGQGEGGKPPENPHEVKFQTTKTPGKIDPQGQIIGHMWTKGSPSLKDDEKKAEYTAAHDAAAKAATEAVESGKIPRELREYVRNYFDTTRPAAPAPGAPGKGAEKGEPEKPAADKK
jgi:hypothetical protein